MDYIIFICKIVYILFCLPSHQCQKCGTLRVLNTDDINQGEDVRLEFSINRSYNTNLVGWWKYKKWIDTTLPRFSIDIQPDRVMLIIRNFTVVDNGEYGVKLRNTDCSPPRNILLTVKETKVLSINPKFAESFNIPEIDCANCLVGTVCVYKKVECIVFGVSRKDLNIEMKLKKNGQDVPNVTVEASSFYRAFYDYMPSAEDTDHTVTCEVTRAGQQPVTVSITLVILRKPSIPEIILPASVKEGNTEHITCKAFNARPEPRLYFTYNKTTYNTSNSFSKMKDDKTVDAKTIFEQTFSRYDNTRSLKCCVEFKEFDKNTPKMLTNCSTYVIDVLFPPKFLQIEELNRTNDEEGNTNLMLQCTSDVSNPDSTIRWNISPNVKRSQFLSANLRRHNNGETLSCYIENPAFPEIKVTETYTLNITYKPFISFSPSSSITTYVDDSISVLCQCDANPPAKIEWSNTSSNEIGERTEVSLELKMQFHSTGRHNFTCNATNAMGSAENAVLILVKEKPSELTKAIPRPTSLSTGKVISSSMLIGIICGCLAIVLIVIIAFVCVVVVWKTREKTPTRERSDNVLIQEGEPSFQPLGPDYNDLAGTNPVEAPSGAIPGPVEYTCVVKRAVGQATKPQVLKSTKHSDAPSEAIAEPVEYTSVVKRAVRQATNPQIEDGALIYADLDLPAEGSTRRKPTVNSDAETTYVSIDFAQTKKMKRSVLDD
ncbi:uncharacterized protein LOC128234980 isoform X2 [Mya arenaria]|uniref:uncharacterized protein LOC128234980 isoform X2 n=1 Tax=Mya arenaria TaxID=6604 RepID=UPI0022E8B422|nr:uncharacterized protein LOC128234980 isoform X2 [Mya arenaria]